MAKSEAIYHGDPRHHHSDIVKLKARVKELEEKNAKLIELGDRAIKGWMNLAFRGFDEQ